MNTIITQILIMAILIMVGYVLCKTNFIDKNVTSSISNLLLRFIIPLTIVEAFIGPFSWDRLKQMLIISILGTLAILLLIVIANLFFKENQTLEKYASIFSNKGFIGIPIISALFGREAIALVTPIIVVSNVFVWTYGLSLLNKEKMHFNIKDFITNPSVIGLIIGLIIFVLPFELPYPITQSISSLTSINTPMAMLIIGTYLAEQPIIDVFTNKSAYKVSLLRLIIMPIVILFIVKFLPLEMMVKNVLVVSMAVPTAANTAMFAQITGSDYSHGAQIVCLSTILSGLTLPFIIYLMELFLV